MFNKIDRFLKLDRQFRRDDLIWNVLNICPFASSRLQATTVPFCTSTWTTVSDPNHLYLILENIKAFFSEVENRSASYGMSWDSALQILFSATVKLISTHTVIFASILEFCMESSVLVIGKLESFPNINWAGTKQVPPILSLSTLTATLKDRFWRK